MNRKDVDELWKKLKEMEEEQRKETVWSRGGDHCDDPCCPCHRYRRQPRYPGQECSLNKPLWMVIPPEGIHISCPVHGKHFIQGNQVTCSTDFGPVWRSEVHQ